MAVPANPSSEGHEHKFVWNSSFRFWQCACSILVFPKDPANPKREELDKHVKSLTTK